jgi:ubiquinone/menaquinone biosynthesis C-methylase UbiE
MSTHDLVKDYYGKQLQSSADLKTDACCDLASMPAWLPPLLGNIHSDVLDRYYGCGLVAPLKLEGCRVLDLGCGTGRDVYALAQLVGASGEVVGVDMTDEQLEVARKYQDHHSEKFGFANTQFLKGYIERLDELGLEPESFDVIVSNCVINLSTDKAAVLAGALKLLKPGGEFYFSDVYSDRRVPTEVAKDPVLYGECLGGALYWGDFMKLSKQAGFADPRLVESRPLAVDDLRLLAMTRGIGFFSATYRLFKHECLEPECEDYGQAVIYQGGIAGAEQVFVLDTGHTIERGRVFPVCGNTWLMLEQTRFKEHFTFIGNFDVHYGVFEGCGGGLPYAQSFDEQGISCC